jgi:hypothetical protein
MFMVGDYRYCPRCESILLIDGECSADCRGRQFARRVACRLCGARRGDCCKYPNGRRVPGSHAVRQKLARAQDGGKA